MKIRLIFASLLLFSGFMVTAQNTSNSNPPVMIENQSRFGFAETVEKLSKNILEKGWKITITHDLQETMKKNSKEVLPVKVMELCNPGLAFRILSKDELRNVSPMLPCRISVYEKSDGITYISRMNAPAFAGMIGGDAAKTIVQAFNETEEFVKAVTK
ncbi:MAG: DUF302 domain-containing protein [Bacteroidales bacterium]|nr:DUF302 domain-containing protein [Bacteroidales bacterium]